MIAVIRIVGKIGVRRDARETMDRMRIRKKYTCVLIKENPEILGMLKVIRNQVAYGPINDETLEKLVELRGQKIEKSKDFDIKKVVEGIKKDKEYSELGIKPFFRLHPPRKGIKSKLHYPEGVLGNNKEDINKLIERML